MDKHHLIQHNHNCALSCFFRINSRNRATGSKCMNTFTLAKAGPQRARAALQGHSEKSAEPPAPTGLENAAAELPEGRGTGEGRPASRLPVTIVEEQRTGLARRAGLQLVTDTGRGHGSRSPQDLRPGHCTEDTERGVLHSHHAGSSSEPDAPRVREGGPGDLGLCTWSCRCRRAGRALGGAGWGRSLSII